MVNKQNISIIEVAISVLILLFAYLFSTSFESYSIISPHPIYVLVSLIAIRNGYITTLYISTLFTIMYISFYIWDYNSLQGFINYRNIFNIALTFLSSIIFGVGYDKYIQDIIRLKQNLSELSNNFDDLDEEHKNLLRLYSDLKSQIINSDTSILNLYDIAKKFNSYDVEELYTELLAVLTKYLRTNHVSIYTNINDRFLRLKLKNSEHFVPYSIDLSNNRIYSEIIKQKRALRRIDVKIKDFPIMSAPIINNDKIIAIVNIDNLGFSEANEYSFQIFKMIIDWFENGIKKVNYLDEDSYKYHYDTNIMKPNYFFERVESEKIRKQKYNLDFVLLELKIPTTPMYDLNNQLTDTFRSVDVFSYDVRTKTLYILCPATQKKYEELMKKKAQSLFKRGV